MVVVGFDVHGLTVGVLNGTGHGTKCESVAEDLTTGLEAGRLQEKHNGRSTRVKSHAVLVASVVCDFPFTEADCTVGILYIVTVQASRSHQLKSGLLTLKRDGIRGLDIASNICAVLEAKEVKMTKGENIRTAIRDSAMVSIQFLLTWPLPS